MTIIEKHKDDYQSLKKKELLKILDEVYAKRKKTSAKAVYKPINSVRNNNRRALKDWYRKRHQSDVAKAKVKEKIKILRGIK